MSWAKICFPTRADEVRGFYELARHTRVVSFREAGRGMFQVPIDALSRLRVLQIPFEVTAEADAPRIDPQRQP